MLWKNEISNCISNNGRNGINNGRNEGSANDEILFHVGITYVQGMSESVQKQLSSRNHRVGIAHRNSNSLRNNYNRVKEKIPKMNRSDVVYKIPCSGGAGEICGECYVGTTGRMMKDRMKEHAGDLAKKIRHTALVDHALDEGHFFDFQNVSILAHEPNYRKRMIKEGCHISIEDSVNYRTDTNNVSKLYHNILNNLKIK